MSTLIYHSGALGDFIACLPLLFRISNSPYGPVSLIGNPDNIAIASASGFINRGVDCNSSTVAMLFRDKPDRSEIRTFIQEYRLIILFSAHDSPLAQNIRKCATVPVIIHPPFPEKQLPVTQYHLELLKQINLPAPVTATESVPFITIAGQTKVHVTRQPKPDSLIIHPGSGSQRKNWPFERFITVADTFRKRGLPIVWLTGPAEYDLSTPSQDSRYSNQPILDCCDLLLKGAVFLGNDSGIAHLAAAVGTPSVVLFGPSDPAVWAPKGKKRITIIHHHHACTPCHPGSSNKINCTNECLETIPVEEVISAIECLLPRNIS